MKKIEMNVSCGEDGRIQFYTKKRINVELNSFDIGCLEYDTEQEEWVKIKSLMDSEKAAEWSSETNSLTDKCEYRMPKYMEDQKVRYVLLPYVEIAVHNPDLLDKINEQSGDLRENIQFAIDNYDAARLSVVSALSKCKKMLKELDNVEVTT